jgi:hypothetical protein
MYPVQYQCNRFGGEGLEQFLVSNTIAHVPPFLRLEPNLVYDVLDGLILQETNLRGTISVLFGACMSTSLNLKEIRTRYA